jgi:hypothetical protein
MKNQKDDLPAGINEKHSLALKTATHFGFVPFADLEVTKTDVSKARTFPGIKFDKTLTAAGELDFGGFLEEKISIIRAYIEKKMQDLLREILMQVQDQKLNYSMLILLEIQKVLPMQS